jgi:DNA (cytosine-5)-methyltransferase 1
MKINTVGSVCSGIEAASVSWAPLGMKFEWFSEIADFPSKILEKHYPDIANLGDMNDIPNLIRNRTIASPDLICGGTPCQAFSLAGWQNGLNDDRGNLTLRFVDIIEANDSIRLESKLPRTIVFWENVEGVLTDKTNAFGCLVSSLTGLSEPIENSKWTYAGFIHGTKRNVAWRVLDAKYFGLPQQRKRLYLIAGGTDFFPENILFEKHNSSFAEYPHTPLTFSKEGHLFEVFREYTDCLYASYGTKWNGNAAATNGSLFIVQDNRIRRLSPLETERLMGFPDNYTDLPNAKKTNRYQATGNSWAVPVIAWLGKRLLNCNDLLFSHQSITNAPLLYTQKIDNDTLYVPLGKDTVQLDIDYEVNCSPIPEECVFGSMKDIVSSDAPEDIYIYRLWGVMVSFVENKNEI